jgi:hypothetical protein
VRWFLLWTVLVLGAAGVFFVLGRDIWRKGRLLVRELGAVTDRLSEIGDRLADADHAGDARTGPSQGAGDVRSQGSSPRQQR